MNPIKTAEGLEGLAQGVNMLINDFEGTTAMIGDAASDFWDDLHSDDATTRGEALGNAAFLAVEVTVGTKGIAYLRNAGKGVTAPKGWVTQASNKGRGLKFVDPNNPHNNIRQMPGNPNSPNPAQQNPYVIFKKEGTAYDVSGNPLKSAKDPAAHIPLDKFDFKIMPKFD